jgi:hypothetical protein
MAILRVSGTSRSGWISTAACRSPPWICCCWSSAARCGWAEIGRVARRRWPAWRRVLLALAIGQNPTLLILDEPSAGVDIAGGNLLCELLESLRAQRGFTQIMVTHDLSLVTAHSTHVICLNRRVTGQGPTQQTLRPDVLADTFGIHLGLAHLHLVSDDVRAERSCREHGHD